MYRGRAGSHCRRLLFELLEPKTVLSATPVELPLPVGEPAASNPYGEVAALVGLVDWQALGHGGPASFDFVDSPGDALTALRDRARAGPDDQQLGERVIPLPKSGLGVWGGGDGLELKAGILAIPVIHHFGKTSTSLGGATPPSAEQLVSSLVGLPPLETAAEPPRHNAFVAAAPRSDLLSLASDLRLAQSVGGTIRQALVRAEKSSEPSSAKPSDAKPLNAGDAEDRGDGTPRVSVKAPALFAPLLTNAGLEAGG